MARLVTALLVCLGCGARTDFAAGEVPFEDAGEDTAPSDAAPDTRLPADVGRPPPPRCGFEPEGGLRAALPIGTVTFPYVAIGIEPVGSHSCPRFFLRAGDTPSFDNDVIDIEVPYYRDRIEAGPREASLTAQIGGEFWSETIFLEVTRADGLFESDVPFDLRRGSALIDHHDATSDIVLEVRDEAYCSIFPLCL